VSDPFINQDDLIDQFRRSNADAAFRQATNEKERLTRLLELQGVAPEDLEERPSAWMQALDTIQTPGQWIRGGIANLTNTPGYGDLSLLDAVKKGADANLNTGDIFRANNILTDGSVLSQFGRGALGFVGDVVTDPLSYLSLAASGPRAGGKALAANPVALAEGGTALPKDIMARIVAGATDDAVNATKQSLMKGAKVSSWDDFLAANPGNAAIADDLLSLAGAKAAGASRGVASEARALVENSRKRLPRDIALAGDDAELAASWRNIQATKELTVKNKLGLAPDVPLEALFDDAAIRLSSPFSTATKDIPIVTEASRKAFRMLDGAIYNTNLNVQADLAKQIAKVAKYGADNADTASGTLAANAAVFAQKVGAGLKALPKAVSMELKAGGTQKAQTIDELRIAHGAAWYEAEQTVAPHVKMLQDAGFDSADMDKFTNLLYAYQTEAGKAAVAQGIKGAKRGSAVSTMQLSQAAKEATEKNILRAIENFDEGKRGPALDFFNQMRNRMTEMAKVEADMGLNNYFVESYLPGLREVDDAASAERVAKLARPKAGEVGVAPDFTFAKTFATIADAENKGIKMVKDPTRIWAAREFQHARAVAEKEILERSAFQFGLPEPMRQRLAQMAASQSDDIAQKGVQYLKEWDVPMTPEEALSGFKSPEGLPSLRTVNGEIITPREFDDLIARAEIPGNTGLVARKQARELGLPIDDMGNFDPIVYQKQKEVITNVRGMYDQYKATQLGRAGETISSRAGGLQISDKVKKALFHKLPKKDKQIFNGVLPRSFVGALEEGIDTRNLLRTVGDSLKAQGRSPEASVLYGAAKNYSNWVQLLKKGTLQWWPQYHVGNTISTIPLMGPEMPIFQALGESLSFKNLLRTHKLVTGKNLSVIQEGSGTILPMKQLMHEANLYGFSSKGTKPLDLMEMQSDILDQMGKKEVKSNKWGMLGKVDETLGKTSQYVESFGREMLYYRLRERGFDPQSAAERVTQLFTNYTGNKTRFERVVLNNSIFFYSFAKQQAVNSLMNMVTRPGALTSQVHMFNGIAEMLTDPDANPLPEDIEAAAQTTRTKETLARYVGRSSSGLPQVLTGVGMPMDAMGQLINVRLPKNFTWGELLGAAGDTVGRSSQLLLSSTNPLIKKTMENVISGQNLFFDRPVTDKTLRKVARVAPMFNRILGFPPEAIPGKLISAEPLLKTFLDARDNGDGTWTANPTRLAVMSVVVPGAERFVSTLNAAQSPGIETPHKWLRYLTRAKIQELDPAKAAIFDESKKLRKKAEELGLATSVKKFRQMQALIAAQEEDDEE
jgi:hypothetical protein